jgi:TetR/AcrR family transcriptional regulator
MAVAVTTKAKRPAPSAKAKAALEPVRDAERTRQALLGAAEIEFSTKGFAGARVDVIAD